MGEVDPRVQWAMKIMDQEDYTFETDVRYRIDIEKCKYIYTWK